MFRQFPIKALDANGAGDMFAGAFLYGVSRGMAAAQAAKLANKAAAAVVSQYGNRLTTARVQGLLAEALAPDACPRYGASAARCLAHSFTMICTKSW